MQSVILNNQPSLETLPMRELPAPADEDAAVVRIQSRVDAAAFALLREGKNPTVALVRARMGGGSPNIVAPALQRWRFTLAAQLDANASSALEVLPPAVLELVQALWSRALFEAHRVRADAPSSLDALEQLNSAINELRDQAARLQEREASLDAQQRELDERRRQISIVEVTLARRSEARPAARRSARTPSRPRPTTGSSLRKPAKRSPQRRAHRKAKTR